MTARISQFGIAVSVLGAIITVMALFPGVTGLSPTPGVGLVQVFGILIGFMLLVAGALIYVRFAFYTGQESTLMQQIGTRLAFTGIVLVILASLADSLGFGSHGISDDSGEFFLGRWQAVGIVGSYVMSCLGVLIYAVSGHPEAIDTEAIDDEPDTAEQDEAADGATDGAADGAAHHSTTVASSSTEAHATQVNSV